MYSYILISVYISSFSYPVASVLPTQTHKNFSRDILLWHSRCVIDLAATSELNKHSLPVIADDIMARDKRVPKGKYRIEILWIWGSHRRDYD